MPNPVSNRRQHLLLGQNVTPRRRRLRLGTFNSRRVDWLALLFAALTLLAIGAGAYSRLAERETVRDVGAARSSTSAPTWRRMNCQDFPRGGAGE